MRLTVLMYHNVKEHCIPDDLNVTKQQLDDQFKYLQQNNYHVISLSELNDAIHRLKPLPKKSVLISFDDGYKNNYTCLYPLLVKYNFKAAIFLTAGFIGENNYLSVDEIQSMENNLVEYGLHTVKHNSYTQLSAAEIEEDILRTKKTFKHLGINFQPSLAYTFGDFVKNDPVKRRQMFQSMQQHGIESAFRIGNRINRVPAKNNYLLQRVDVRGTDSLRKFKLMCRFGKKYLFF